MGWDGGAALVRARVWAGDAMRWKGASLDLRDLEFCLFFRAFTLVPFTQGPWSPSRLLWPQGHNYPQS